VLLAAVLLLLVFPDGKLLDRAWWAVVWMAVGGAALLAPSMALDPYPSLNYHPIANPFALEGELYEDVIGPMGSIGFVLLLVSWICAVMAIVVRVDKGTRVERQQIKWLTFLAVVMIVGLGAGLANPWLILLGVAAFNCFPIGVGIAVLRYRLYDIDVVINRTLVYGSLTAMLVAVYFVAIVVLQQIFVGLTGQQSTLAVVASTLVIAALFNPLRRRIQSFIDRRFYRRKYDARKTLEAFSEKLRDETDLEALNDDLVGVVAETMQPAHASLWLRPATDAKVSGQTQESTLDTGFKVEQVKPTGNVQVQGDVTYHEDSKTATFDPENSLAKGLYRVTLTGVEDNAGNVMPDYTWTFATAGPPSRR
jgi:hypothetical protein